MPHYKSRSFNTCARGTCRNLGQNSRSLGHFVRHPFWPKLTVTLRGPQCPAGIWVPYRAPISRLLSLGYFRSVTFARLLSLGSTSLNYCPFGAGMYAWRSHLSLGYFRSVPLRDYFYLRAPSGPLMGTLWAPMWAPLWGTHFQKINLLFSGSTHVGNMSHMQTKCTHRNKLL